MSTLPATSSSRPFSLRVNFSWTFAGNVAYALSQMGIVWVLNWFGGVTGMYATGQSIAATVMAFAMLQLRSVQVTDARSEYPFADYFGTRIFCSLVGFAIIWVLALCSTSDSTEASIIVLVGVIKGLESVSDIVRGLFQRHERMDYSSISLALKGPLSLLVMAAFMWWSHDARVAVASIAAVYLLSFAFYDLLQARRVLVVTDQPRRGYRRLAPRFAPAFIAHLMWIALPLGVIMGLITLQINIPRFVLRAFSGQEAIGYFYGLVQPMQAGQMVVGSLGLSAAPRLARYYLENRAAYGKLVTKLVLLSGTIAAALVLGTVVAGRPFLRIYGHGYADYFQEFVILALAAAIQLFSSAWGYALTSARRFNLQVALTIASCLVMTAASLALIPHWGVRGASFAVLISSTVTATLFFLAVRIAAKEPVPAAKLSESSDLQIEAFAADHDAPR